MWAAEMKHRRRRHDDDNDHDNGFSTTTTTTATVGRSPSVVREPSSIALARPRCFSLTSLRLQHLQRLEAAGLQELVDLLARAC
jgi:hypothetical protein